jgi:vacuolar-type H+-ATPase subunit F/Vma7
MKKLFILLLLLGFGVTALAQNGRQLYNKYSDSPGVEAIYISPTMFKRIGIIPDMELNDKDVNLSHVIKSMTGFYSLSASNAKVREALRKDIDKYIQSSDYELLMESKDDDEIMRIYIVGDEETITSFVMLEYEDDEINFISIDGNMNRAQMEDLLAKTVK